MAEDYKRLATAFKGRAAVAEVDCTVQRELAEEFGVKSYPTLKLFSRGKLLHNYKGARSEQALADFLLTKINPEDTGDVVVLTSNNFKEVVNNNQFVLVKFFAPCVYAFHYISYCQQLVRSLQENEARLHGCCD